ncbi:MAG: hypothetical protein KDC87_05360 [Planctomycetes bacterium]|nr:hypothetical protein [Planctomycetota bacterium]MCB9869823.1 hypothetical protein [Planctomycetota bacterium]
MPHNALDPELIVETIDKLRARIRERFPEANLGNVADSLLTIAQAHSTRIERIRAPNWLLRSLSIALVLGGLATLVLLAMSIKLHVDDEWRVSDAIQTLEAGVSTLFFLGAGAVFAASLELRRKRRRCLQAVHEMRAMAHIVDMHQLTKDPERMGGRDVDTPSSPARSLGLFELTRYLNYCSEMLSLIGKVAALYAQSFADSQALAAVDEVEDLTTGLSRKIWQKIMILDQSAAVAAARPPAQPCPPPPSASSEVPPAHRPE